MTTVQPAGVREALGALLENEGDKLFALALRVTRDNVSQAAKLLGVNRTTLYSRMEGEKK